MALTAKYPLNVRPLFERQALDGLADARSWRLNLCASSSNSFFVAVHHEILVFQLPGLHLQNEPLAPIWKWSGGTTAENQDSVAINAIRHGFLGNEEVVAAVDDSGRVLVFFTRDFKRRPIILQNDVSTWGLAIHPRKNLIAVSSNSHCITVFKLGDDLKPDEQPIMTLKGHGHNIPSIDFSPCGDYLASASIDGTCRIWNISTGEAVAIHTLATKWNWTIKFIQSEQTKHIKAEERVSSDEIPQLASLDSMPLLQSRPRESRRGTFIFDDLDYYSEDENAPTSSSQDLVRPEDMDSQIDSFISAEEEPGRVNDQDTSEDYHDYEDLESDAEEQALQEIHSDELEEERGSSGDVLVGTERGVTVLHNQGSQTAAALVDSLGGRLEERQETESFDDIHHRVIQSSQPSTEGNSEENQSDVLYNEALEEFPRSRRTSAGTIENDGASWTTESEEMSQEDYLTWTPESEETSQEDYLTSTFSSSSLSLTSTRSPSAVSRHSSLPSVEQSEVEEPIPLLELPKGLLLRTTADDVCLMGTMNGKLELLAVLPGLVVDWEGQYAYRGLNRLAMISWIPELGAAVVASQMGKAAVIRIYRYALFQTCPSNAHKEDNRHVGKNVHTHTEYVMKVESWLPVTPALSPVLGVFHTTELSDKDPFLNRIIVHFGKILSSNRLCASD